MLEGEPKRIIPRPEDILTPEGAELLQRTARGEFTCLTCGELLEAEKVISPYYEGISCGVLIWNVDTWNFKYHQGGYRYPLSHLSALNAAFFGSPTYRSIQYLLGGFAGHPERAGRLRL